jgi:hypothetical protein
MIPIIGIGIWIGRSIDTTATTSEYLVDDDGSSLVDDDGVTLAVD